jgi:hypothetical protein
VFIEFRSLALRGTVFFGHYAFEVDEFLDTFVSAYCLPD